MRKVAVALAAVALLAACGGGGGNAQPAGSIKVTMTEYHFEPATISAPSGKVVFFLVNAGTASHDMIFRDTTTGQRVPGAASELVSAGDSFVFTVANLAAGKYKYFCDQPGHEASGMIGDLTVT